MRRLSVPTPFLAVIASVLALQGIFPQRCLAFGWQGWCWGFTSSTSGAYLPGAYVASYPTSTFGAYLPGAYMAYYPTSGTLGAAPSGGVATPPGYVAPAYYAPTYAQPAYAQPAYAAPAYYAAWSGYQSAVAPLLAQPASTVATPATQLANFDPRQPMVPGLPGYNPASAQAKGSAILQGLRSAATSNPVIPFQSLLQLALNLFGQQFGFGPNNQDYSTLTNLVQQVLGEVLGTTGTGTSGAGGTGVSGPPTTGVTSGPGAQTAPSVIFTVTVQSGATVNIQNPPGTTTTVTTGKGGTTGTGNGTGTSTTTGPGTTTTTPPGTNPSGISGPPPR